MNKEDDKHQPSTINHRPLKIGIDVSPVIYQTGVSYYTRSLVKALLEVDKQDTFVLFGGSLRRKKEIDRFIASLYVKNVVRKTYNFPPTFLDFVWNELHILPIERFTGRLDVFHSSDWAQPPSRAKKVTTIHDLVPLRFPEISHRKVVLTHKKRLRWVKEEADKIIAVSQFSKKEAVELLGIEPQRIVVIPEAADPSIKPVKKRRVEEIKRKYGVYGDYLLVVGRDPRKNLPAIVQAYGKLKKDLKLVVVGRKWEELPRVKGLVELGHVAREDMPSLYSGARALVYTSLYEGFGLPILEAMQAGCPVVTSNLASMPEVAGEGAVLVDPTNPTDIASGIEKVLSDREEWIKKGKKQADKFSWEKTARETLRVYREVKSEE